MDPPYVEISMIGNAQVGKTSILKSFIGDHKKCIIEEFRNGTTYTCRNITIAGIPLNMRIWDPYERIRYEYSSWDNRPRYNHGIILVYDVTKRSSFENLEYWVESLSTPHTFRIPTSTIVVGNRTDLPNRAVFEEEARIFAKSHNAMYAECSSKVAQDATVVFEKLLREIRKRYAARGVMLPGLYNLPIAVDEAGNSRVDDQPQEVPSTWCNII